MTDLKTYRKKPVTIHAMQLPHPGPRAGAAVHAVTSWMENNGYPFLIGNYLDPDSLRYSSDPHDDERPTKGIYIDPADGALMIRTLEGDMRATPGDYIIRGISGEFYPCKPDIFAETYEETWDSYGPLSERGDRW